MSYTNANGTQQPKINTSALQNYVQNDREHTVVIYADWCGHCKNMKQKLGSNFQQYDHLTFLEESQVAEDLKDHYPHVHIYNFGKRRDGTLNDVYSLFN